MYNWYVNQTIAMKNKYIKYMLFVVQLNAEKKYF